MTSSSSFSSSPPCRASGRGRVHPGRVGERRRSSLDSVLACEVTRPSLRCRDHNLLQEFFFFFKSRVTQLMLSVSRGSNEIGRSENHKEELMHWPRVAIVEAQNRLSQAEKCLEYISGDGVIVQVCRSNWSVRVRVSWPMNMFLLSSGQPSLYLTGGWTNL